MHTPLQNDLIACAGGQRFATILADPPWQFQNRTGKMAPEHRRLARYGTLALPDIGSLPVSATSPLIAPISIFGFPTRCYRRASR